MDPVYDDINVLHDQNYQNINDFDVKEIDKLRQFLEKARLSKYLSQFLQNGVTKVTDLQNYVKEDFLIQQLHMSQPERERFWKHVDKSRPFFKRFRKTERPDTSIYAELQTLPIMGAKLISHQELSELGIIGKGGFGEVSKGLWHYQHNMPPRPVAIKIVGAYSEGNRDQIMREAEVWNRLNHENIISLYGVTLTQPFKMIMELAPKGSLDKYLRNKVNQLSIERMWQYATQIRNGMEYLHSKRIIHRDLACRNVLMITEIQVKISDFGMTRFLPMEKDLMETITPQKVPFAWTSLEVFETGQYSKPNDVWSFAVTMWETFSYGAKPWKGLSMQEVKLQLQLEKRLEQPLLCSDDIFSLMSRCWSKDPVLRPTFTDLQTELKKVKPQLVIAKLDSPINLDEDQCVPYRKEDFICIIQKKLGEYWVGQSQVNLKVGYILAADMETDQKKIQTFQRNLAKKKQRFVPTPNRTIANYLNIDIFPEQKDKVNEVVYSPADVGNKEYTKGPALPPRYQNLDFMPQDQDDIQYEHFNTEQQDDPFDDYPYDCPDEPPQNDVTKHMSVCLANRIKLTDSFVYTTMGPTGLKEQNDPEENEAVTRDLNVLGQREPPEADDDDPIYDPYVFHDRVFRKDSDGYDLPDTETEIVTLRKIRSSSRENRINTAFYDDTISDDTALTPQQLNNRKRASLKLGSSSVYSPPEGAHKPIPPPKPTGIKPRMMRKSVREGGSNVPYVSRPLNETILTKEFPQIPENEIPVILSISGGNIREARKDLKFKLFMQRMRMENPELQSVFCYDVFKKSNFDSESASNEIRRVLTTRRLPNDDTDAYEVL